jgi:hypothetical protein
MKYEIATLEGALLDAAVAKAEGIELIEQDQGGFAAWDSDHACWRGWSACTDWRIAGPIIERKRIAAYFIGDGWSAVLPDGSGYPGDCDYIDVNGREGSSGPTPLIAAMRAFVCKKLGDEVDLP